MGTLLEYNPTRIPATAVLRQAVSHQIHDRRIELDFNQSNKDQMT
jgi:hypothetical protein